MFPLAKALQQPAQVGSGEAPFGWRCELVALLEGEQPVLNGVETGEVVGGDDLALDDAELDLDLVEPAGDSSVKQPLPAMALDYWTEYDMRLTSPGMCA